MAEEGFTTRNNGDKWRYRTCPSMNAVFVSVVHQGIGIPGQYSVVIVEKFRQGTSKDSNKADAAGLGLQHGSTI